ncbi:hypothetical protein LXL04_010901 [Taraxacum kok-saghyz]
MEDARSGSVNVEDASSSLSSTMAYDQRIPHEDWWPPAGGSYRKNHGLQMDLIGRIVDGSVVKLGQLGRVLGRVLGLGLLLRRVKSTRSNYSEIGQTRFKLGETILRVIHGIDRDVWEMGTISDLKKDEGESKNTKQVSLDLNGSPVI